MRRPFEVDADVAFACEALEIGKPTLHEITERGAEVLMHAGFGESVEAEVAQKLAMLSVRPYGRQLHALLVGDGPSQIELIVAVDARSAAHLKYFAHIRHLIQNAA